eukprot:CAMPEP_0119266706 /NCGR_PEP_ID=MMETSP1329-20130426/5110_1 /TAXON_ID=114041 /ORGANISM="Genus nov. species nov., Strain RCC1024" /LENGTH=173 /DNA_ID=CAMNT_0007266599 /DNA_START=239 /DNA_END=756 /DNA_ORIENTATION=-
MVDNSPRADDAAAAAEPSNAPEAMLDEAANAAAPESLPPAFASDPAPPPPLPPSEAARAGAAIRGSTAPPGRRLEQFQTQGAAAAPAPAVPPAFVPVLAAPVPPAWIPAPDGAVPLLFFPFSAHRSPLAAFTPSAIPNSSEPVWRPTYPRVGYPGAGRERRAATSERASTSST